MTNVYFYTLIAYFYLDISKCSCFFVGHSARNQYGLLEHISESLRIYRCFRVILVK